MAKYDLVSRISPCLDRHLVIPLLNFHLNHTKLFIEEDLLKAKFELLAGTDLVDLSIGLFKTLNPGKEVDPELVARREEVVARLHELDDLCQPLMTLLQSDEVKSHMEKRQDTSSLRVYLQEKHAVTQDKIEVLFEYSQALFEVGKYEPLDAFLYQYSVLADTPEKVMAALWGKLAASILTQKWESTQTDLEQLKHAIDNSAGPALQQLQQRTWLIHWSLFIFWNHEENGREQLIDLFLRDKPYANAIQTNCPWILRYITAAVVTCPRRRQGTLKELVKVITQEAYNYRDPITEFLECVYVNFDFDGAQTKLRECEAVLLNDFFLTSYRDQFIEHARLIIFETYCRIHSTISISMLAEKLNMAVDRAEEWIVNLIREAHLDAKIDSKEGHVLMTPHVPSMYSMVIEKTKTLSYRSAQLAESISGGSANFTFAR